MTRQAERICELAQESADAEDPDVALRTLMELRGELDSFVDVQVARALVAGRSFSDVARALGISRQAAHRRFRDLAPVRRPGREGARKRRRALVATDAVRNAVKLAHAEALAAGLPPGSEHVLLGVARTDCETMRALRAKGVTPERVRAEARSSRGQRTHSASTIPRIVKRAAQIAVSRADDELDVEPLLLAAIADADGGAKRTLAALAVPTRDIDDRLHD